MANVKSAAPAAETKIVFIPRTNKDDTERYVAVNGENMLIQTGQNVEGPLRFAEAVENSQRQDAAAEAYIAAFATGG